MARRLSSTGEIPSPAMVQLVGSEQARSPASVAAENWTFFEIDPDVTDDYSNLPGPMLRAKFRS